MRGPCWKSWVVAFGLMLAATGCTGILGPTEEHEDPGAESQEDAGQDDTGTAEPDLELSRASAKPFDRVPIEGLPDEVALEDIHATIYPEESIEHLGGDFPGIVLPAEASEEMTLVAPYLGRVEGGRVEVVLHLEERDSDRLPLEIDATEVDEGAFSEAMSHLAESTKAVVEKTEYTEQQLRDQLAGEEEITEASFGIAAAYHLTVDPENPNRLTDLEVDDETQQFLDVFATRVNLRKQLEQASSDLEGFQRPLSGHVGEGGGRSGETKDVPPGQLSDLMHAYATGDEVLEQLDAVGTALSVGSLVAAGVATGGGATAAASAISTAASQIGLSLSIVEFLTSALNAIYPCCIQEMEHELATSPKPVEDAPTPQVQVSSVEVLARSDGTQVALEFFNLAADILLDKIGDTEAVENGISRIVPDASRRLTEAFGLDEAFADFAVSNFLMDKVNSLVKKVVDAAVGDSAVVDVRQWESQLHGVGTDGNNGRNWLTVSIRGDGSRSILDDAGTEQNSLQWRLTKEAYDYGSSTIVLGQDTDQFPIGDYGEAQATSQRIRMREIEVQIDPPVTNAEGGAEVEFTTRVKHANDTSIETIEAEAGTVVEQVDPNEENAAEQQFVWKAPENKEQFPVDLVTRSKSDEGLRGELMGTSPSDLPPERKALATVYNGDHLSIPGIPCVETGESRGIEARVTPRDEELSWQLSGAGSLSVSDDTHTAVYQAPSSETDDEITVMHADDDEVSDSTTVHVRDRCLCTFHVWVGGHVDNFVEDTGRTLKANVDEKEGSFAVSYLGDDVASTVGAPESLTVSELTEGTTEFVGPFEYHVGLPLPDVIVGQERAPVEVHWRDEFRPVVSTSGIAAVCYRDGGECNPDEDPTDTAPFRATYFPPAQRRTEEGNFEAVTCDGKIRETGDTGGSSGSSTAGNSDGDDTGGSGGDSGGDDGSSDGGGSGGSDDGGSSGGSGGGSSCPDPKEPSFDCPDATTCCEHNSSDTSCEYQSPCHIPDEINDSDDWTCTPGMSC